MRRRSRVLANGAAAVLVLVGVVCAVLVAGTLGQVLAMALIGVGLVLAVSLVFFEVGLSEDHEREREQAKAQEREGRKPRRPRPRLGRMRDHQRRIKP